MRAGQRRRHRGVRGRGADGRAGCPGRHLVAADGQLRRGCHATRRALMLPAEPQHGGRRDVRRPLGAPPAPLPWLQRRGALWQGGRVRLGRAGLACGARVRLWARGEPQLHILGEQPQNGEQTGERPAALHLVDQLVMGRSVAVAYGRDTPRLRRDGRKHLHVAVDHDVERRLLVERQGVARHQTPGLQVPSELVEHGALEEAENADRLEELIQVRVEASALLLVRVAAAVWEQVVRLLLLPDGLLTEVLVPVPVAVAQPHNDAGQAPHGQQHQVRERELQREAIVQHAVQRRRHA